MRLSRLWKIWLIGVALLLSGIFFVQRNVVSSAPLVRPSERWVLPNLPENRDLVDEAVLLASQKQWGKPQDKVAELQEPKWKVSGVFSHNKTLRAIIIFQDENQPTLYLKVGDALPSGQKIASIESDSIVIRSGKQKIWIAIQDPSPLDTLKKRAPSSFPKETHITTPAVTEQTKK